MEEPQICFDNVSVWKNIMILYTKTITRSIAFILLIDYPTEDLVHLLFRKKQNDSNPKDTIKL